jgi:crotonobetaine/carnitine-CoA ligase
MAQPVHWNRIRDTEETFPAILSRMAQSDPDRPFARTLSGEALDWRGLSVAVDNWADRFVSLGVRKGDVVTTILDSSLESLSIWLGLVSIGAVDATINSEFRGRILAYAVNTCAPSLIVVDQSYLPHLEAISGELENGAKVLVIGDDPAPQGSDFSDIVNIGSLSTECGAAAAHRISPQWHDIACVTFTSGTTGPSKAVRIPWGQLNAINLGTFPFEDLDATDVFYCFTAHAHFGSKSIPYLAAMTGGQVVIRPRFSLNSFWEDIGRFGITTASLVGTMADMLMQSPDSPPQDTSLRNMFMAPLGPSYRQFAERFDLRICTVYNSTENGVPIWSGWNPSNDKTVGRLRQGYPGFEVRLVDEHDFEVPDGTPGECVVRSSVPWTMNAGYLNNPEATAAAWRNGWFHTGDALMRSADGGYTFVDRLKDVIRRRGENISSFEVEADVKLNPQVAECAAVAVPAETSEDEILLFFTARPGSSLAAEELSADLEMRMTRFMVPRYVERIDAFPKTEATERIIKGKLRERGLGPQTWDRARRRYLGGPSEPTAPR